MFKSKWTRHNILKHIDDHYPEISIKLLGLKHNTRLQISNFCHDTYGRLFAHKLRRGNKIAFTTEIKPTPKTNKAFMNEWIKKDISKKKIQNL